MRFKPIYERTARANGNKNIVFCDVNVLQAREIAEEYNIHAIPCFKFFLNGKEHGEVEGAREPQFRSKLSDLYELTASRAGNHSWT